jgi:hydrogenase maturation protease
VPELRDPCPGPHAPGGLPGRRPRPGPPERGALIPKTARPQAPRILIIGFGNPGRRDDGLGPAAIEKLKERRLCGVGCDADYQLNIEDALAVSRHDLVVFVDAARGLRRPFAFRPVRPARNLSAMSHALSPGAVLALAAELYGRTPEAWILAIRGHRWTIGEGLSAKAEANLGLALEFLVQRLREARP